MEITKRLVRRNNPYDRSAEIQEICQRQKITSLVHFTRLENLDSILQRGLLSVQSQRKYSVENVVQNDLMRLDNHPDAISLSISFPNYQLFFKFRNENQSDWVVIELDASILWKLDCAFCRENAASNAVRHIPLTQRRDAGALKELFDDYPGVSRAESGIPLNFTTHPQAEVLVFNPIPTSYFKTVFFLNPIDLKRWKNRGDPSFDCKFEVVPKYFQPRVDFVFWQSNPPLEENNHEKTMQRESYATRPIFVPAPTVAPYVKDEQITFNWYSGFSISQAQKSIDSLHTEAKKTGYWPILEISTKSRDALGISLSAFNLQLSVPGHQRMSVECAFQGSKVFENGGPYTDLYDVSSYEAKKDERIRTSGDLIGFRLDGKDYPKDPKTAFFDWLYLRALFQNRHLADQLKKYKAFSDIAFNHKKSINCQARAAALYVALSSITNIGNLINNDEIFWRVLENKTSLF